MRKFSQDKKNMIWNMIAAMLNALESVIILMVVSRVAPTSVAGMCTIAFSIANLFLKVGKFGTRNYQILHENQDISTEEFIKARRITTGGMIFCICLYVGTKYALHQYGREKTIIIIGICIWYIIEAYEDVYLSSFQARGRLDIGNMLFIARWLGIYLSFISVALITRHIELALAISDIVAIILEIIILRIVNRRFPFRRKDSQYDVKALLKANVVLCIADFFYFFITNIPKYAIDMNLSDDIQAIYGYIAMPVFIIALLNNMIYQPQLTHYVDDLRKKDYGHLFTKVRRQIFIILVLMGICYVGSYILGIPILSFIYHTDLSSYKKYMLLCVVSSGFLAIGGYLSTILVIMDERNKNLIVYTITLIIGLIITFAFTSMNGMEGAVYGYLVTMIVLGGFFGILFCFVVKKRRKGLACGLNIC